jgi:hypothetical protein
MSPPEVWGPAIWRLFHTLAENINENEYHRIYPQLFFQIQRICKFLPCPECAKDASIFLGKVKLSDLKTKTEFINIFYLFHNYVNAKKRKPLFNYANINIYKNYRIINVVNNFIAVYNTKGNMKLIAESFQRQFVIKEFKNWIMHNIKFFIPIQLVQHNIDKIPETENVEEIPETENVEEIPEIKNVEEIPENVEEIPETENVEEIPEIKNVEEIPENVEEIPEIKNVEEIPEIKNVEEIPENVEEIPEIKNVEESLESISDENNEQANSSEDVTTNLDNISTNEIKIEEIYNETSLEESVATITVGKKKKNKKNKKGNL